MKNGDRIQVECVSNGYVTTLLLYGEPKQIKKVSFTDTDACRDVETLLAMDAREEPETES